MIIVNLFDKSLWDIWIEGSHYNTTPKTRMTVANWCVASKADLCFNLALFNLNNGNTITYVHNANGDIGYGNDKSNLVRLNDQNWCRGYSNGIINGTTTVNAPLGGARTRNGIGLTKSGKIIIAQCNSRMYEKSFCNSVNNFVKKQGEFVDIFVLQDGGASTSMYSNISKLSFAPEGGRKVATVVCLKRKYSGTFRVNRQLKYRCKGEDVKLLQQFLGGIEVDGSFGRGSAGTEQRVKAFQRKMGLKQDGICGPATLKALGIQYISSTI